MAEKLTTGLHKEKHTVFSLFYCKTISDNMFDYFVG